MCNEKSTKQAEHLNSKNINSEPGSGLRSLKTTPGFALFNFELYARPNKVVMIFGLTALTGCVAFLAYMNATSENNNNKGDNIPSLKRKSKWE